MSLRCHVMSLSISNSEHSLQWTPWFCTWRPHNHTHSSAMACQHTQHSNPIWDIGVLVVSRTPYWSTIILSWVLPPKLSYKLIFLCLMSNNASIQCWSTLIGIPTKSCWKMDFLTLMLCLCPAYELRHSLLQKNEENTKREANIGPFDLSCIRDK